MTAGTEYTVVTRVKATGSAFASDNSTALTVTTKTSAASAPVVEDATVTQNSITLPYDVKWEYRYKKSSDTGFGSWQNGENMNTFASLIAATSYSFDIRITETNTAMASNTTSKIIYTAKATPSALSDTISIDGKTNKITIKSGYEVRADNDFTSGSNVATDAVLTGDTTYYVRAKADTGGAPASESINFTHATVALSEGNI